MMDPMSGLSNADAVVFSTRVQMEQNRQIQRLCWDRCVDTQHDISTTASSSTHQDPQDILADPTKRCIDRCVSKFADTAMLVSAESQMWQLKAMRSQAIQDLTTKAMW